MNHSQVIKDAFRDELDMFERLLRKSVESGNSRVSEIVNYVFSASGKRLRPILTLMSAKACGGITDATYHAAAALELLHGASLVHDDVIDQADLRRGKPSTAAVYGNIRAILVGDYLFAVSLQEGIKTGYLQILELLAVLTRNLSEGELDQFALAEEIVVDEARYFDVIDKKTASLLSACTTIGAKTAGAAPDVVERFARLGQLLGIAFQIRDDIFDYYKSDVGKPTGNDIREGKITLPLIYALNNAPADGVGDMLRIIRSRDYTEENIATLLDFAKRNGGIAYAYDTMNHYLTKADEILLELDINEDIKALLQLFLMYLRDRTY